jgi:V/A-type H+-transporting ATPase subunit G/H
MSLEAVKQVTDAEQLSKERKAQAAVDAKQVIASAEQAGQKAVADAKKQAEAKVQELLAQAEQAAAGEVADIRKQADADCAALRTKAEGRLEDAASLIVRKVVDA